MPELPDFTEFYGASDEPRAAFALSALAIVLVLARRGRRRRGGL